VVGIVAGYFCGGDSGGAGDSREEGHEEYGFELHFSFSCGVDVRLVVEIGC